MKGIYLLSGLGADKRVFDFIELSPFNINHINWVDPLESEPIESYAKRLLAQVAVDRPILIGVSFGGMIAVEMSKHIEAEKVILISSAKTKFDIPIYFRIVGKLRLNRLVPTTPLKTVNPVMFWFFGTKTQMEKNLLRAIIKDTDKGFLRWAIDKIVNWKNTSVPENLVHIHGTADKILPLQTANHTISNGGHLMIVNKGTELSQLIKEVLT
jgi:pimeloyl-ACP methyl ester carboxylesterase